MYFNRKISLLWKNRGPVRSDEMGCKGRRRGGGIHHIFKWERIPAYPCIGVYWYWTYLHALYYTISFHLHSHKIVKFFPLHLTELTLNLGYIHLCHFCAGNSKNMKWPISHFYSIEGFSLTALEVSLGCFIYLKLHFIKMLLFSKSI